MSLYEWIATVLELYICLILTLEYLWGKPDVVMQHEEKQRKRLRKAKFDALPPEGEAK